MQLTNNQKRLIERIINAFETGTADGDYGNISVYHDGPHNIRQITYGRSQTTEYGNLRQLVSDYANASGLFSSLFQPYVDLVGSTPLTDDANFKNILRNAGRQDPIMRRVQDAFFERVYFKPAMKWADVNGFALPLSALVIYDSFIHSGQILWLLRNRFSESPPVQGGNEKVWTTEYIEARDNWLRNHSRSAVRSSAYRTKCLKREIDRGNWDLSQIPVNANGVLVTP